MDDEAKFRELDEYRGKLFRTEPNLKRCEDLFMAKARELFPTRDIRWNKRSGNVEIAESEVANMSRGCEVDWCLFKSNLEFDGKRVVVLSGKDGTLCVGTNDPVLVGYATRKPRSGWRLEVTAIEIAKKIIAVCDAADAFERKWNEDRTPTTKPPNPWRWGISRFNRLQLEADGRNGIELPCDRIERDAYVALANEFDARSKGKSRERTNL